MDAVSLEIYRHLFASVAEEMGATLQRAAYSPNIKERRDFSCAVFDARGEMVAQAAHIPVHLGSTPMSVAAAIEALHPGRGQHVMLNDPYAGGTHLPDLTLVTPVVDARGRLRYYVANRAHHADVGGITAGSLPLSRHIDEEGIRIGPTLWSAELEAEILAASRTPDERRGDLMAQLAANRRGVQRLLELIDSRGEQLDSAAEALQDYSERFMRQLLLAVPDGRWAFEDALDDDGFGHGPLPIRCTLSIDGDTVTVDFRGSSPPVEGPVNVPRAVTLSAVLYALRCLAPRELPTNGGPLRCIELICDSPSLVDAHYPSPVAVGNVETSQRITDVVLGALAQAFPEVIPAASCGSMNNVLIGGADARRGGAPFAYYETLAGGAGASPQGPGASAVHTHMTNTLNTPIEALEHAYPFRVERYAVRRGSGGAGRYRGGDGIVRVYAFDEPATVTLMTERRRLSPYGLAGGDAGARGANWLRHRDGRLEVVAPKVTLELEAGSAIIIETPGGGGWGLPAHTEAVGGDLPARGLGVAGAREGVAADVVADEVEDDPDGHQ